MKAKLHSNDKDSEEATERTIMSLGGAYFERDKEGNVIFDSDGWVNIIGGDEGFLRFSLTRQGYVKEIK